MLCHSVCSCFSPVLSLKLSSVARLNLATGVPLGVYFHLRVFSQTADQE